MKNTTVILNADSYKFTHFRQSPKGTSHVSAYLTARGTSLPVDKVVWVGLQPFIKDKLLAAFTQEDIDQAEKKIIKHTGPNRFNRPGWEYILKKHKGRLPIRIQALPEGSLVKFGLPMVQVINEDPEGCHWLTTYVETMLMRACWYMATVATISYNCKKTLYRYLQETSDNPDMVIDFQLHDFGARGVSSEESAALGGLGHLFSFKGTDNFNAILAAEEFYHEEMAGFSIPASEHSTMTIFGREHEADAYINMIDEFGGPGTILAFVIDSYDMEKAAHMIGTHPILRSKIMNHGGRVVVRPDSGEPTETVPKLLQILESHYGSRLNAKGYKVLPDFIRVIQGDGINFNALPEILESIKRAGFSTENLAFGMGGGLLQKLDRDTFRWAMKASWAMVNGKAREFCKQPKTDPGKASSPGRFAVIEEKGELVMIKEDELKGRPNMLRDVYANCELVVDEAMQVIRERLDKSFKAEMGAVPVQKVSAVSPKM